MDAIKFIQILIDNDCIKGVGTIQTAKEFLISKSEPKVESDEIVRANNLEFELWKLKCKYGDLVWLVRSNPELKTDIKK